MLQHLPDIEHRASSSRRRRRCGALMCRNTGIYWIRLCMYVYLSVMVLLVFNSVVVLLFVLGLHAVFTRERADSSLSFVS
uniref:Uncharacterized protein n=1 Tax=Phytophthora fragariae TaxID=53985 RepID=A0A6A3DC09_9STRA|nr:hypothetical protein PF009_g32541 [Phytophthora fragariae]